MVGPTKRKPRCFRSRLPFRGADHLLFAHAGDRHGERPHHLLLPAPRGVSVTRGEGTAGRILLGVGVFVLLAWLGLAAAAPPAGATSPAGPDPAKADARARAAMFA